MAHKRIAGVAAGLARYFDVDTVLVRILMVVLVFWGGMGLVFYIAGWIAMPKDTNPRPVPANAPEPAAAR